MNQPSSHSTESALEYDELLARCMGNIALVERVLDKYQQSFDGDLADLEEGLAAENSDAVAGVAHRLKGASNNVGASGLGYQAALIEDLAREQRFSEIPSCVEQMRNEWSLFAECVAELDFSKAIM